MSEKWTVTLQLLIALGAPLLLLSAGALAKKLVGGKGWRRSDFYLGVELALASMSAGLVFVFDLASGLPVSDKSSNATLLSATGIFLVICFFILLWIMSFHQDWEPRNDEPRAQIIRLGLVCNSAGIALFTSFVLLVKGLSP